MVALAQRFTGPLPVEVEDKHQGPPRLHDLPSLQKLCGSRFGWSAARTLEVAQELFNGEGKKVITTPLLKHVICLKALSRTCRGSWPA